MSESSRVDDTALLPAEAEQESVEPTPEPAGERRRRSWRRGGSSVRRWGWELVGWAVLALGAGVIAATAAGELIGGETGAVLSTLALWAVFAATVALAFARSRPRGLLRFRPVDLLFGVALGLILRLAQGWAEMAAGGNGAWPTYPSLDGALPADWALDQLLGAAIVAPVIEEFFFRGLVLVAVFTAVRRMAGATVAGFASVIASAALFTLAHALLAPLAWDAVLSLSLVGIVAGTLVVLTGRIWAAVLTHVVYNGLWVALATVGTLLSA